MMLNSDSLLLVIPAVVEWSGDEIRVDGDFASNLRAYLKAFSTVRVMCPALAPGSDYSFPDTCGIEEIDGYERLSIIVLPVPYREDRYYRHLRAVRAQLVEETARHQYLLISPHAAFDWSTLAAEICIEKGICYNMEADWNVPEVRAGLWAQMNWGLNKVRKYCWKVWHDRKYYKVLRHSSLALLQGGDVYQDLKDIAPNAHLVLNVQVGESEHIDHLALERKVESISSRTQIEIGYAGRASAIKGPFHWLDVITQLRGWGCAFHATWAGDGEELAKMREIVRDRDLDSVCSLVGKIDRDAAQLLMAGSDIFLFCHMAKESPRCLVEALARGTPIVGFGAAYAKGLVESNGGGIFVQPGESGQLANIVRSLIDDRTKLASLVKSAAASGRTLDRDKAIAERIDLMKAHLARTA